MALSTYQGCTAGTWIWHVWGGVGCRYRRDCGGTSLCRKEATGETLFTGLHTKRIMLAKNIFRSCRLYHRNWSITAVTARTIKLEHRKVVFIGPCVSKAGRRTVRSERILSLCHELLVMRSDARENDLDRIWGRVTFHDAKIRCAGRGYAAAGGVANAIENVSMNITGCGSLKIVTQRRSLGENVRRCWRFAKIGKRKWRLIEGCNKGSCIAGAGTNKSWFQKAIFTFKKLMLFQKELGEEIELKNATLVRTYFQIPSCDDALCRGR